MFILLLLFVPFQLVLFVSPDLTPAPATSCFIHIWTSCPSTLQVTNHRFVSPVFPHSFLVCWILFHLHTLACLFVGWISPHVCFTLDSVMFVGLGRPCLWVGFPAFCSIFVCYFVLVSLFKFAFEHWFLLVLYILSSASQLLCCYFVCIVSVL